MSRALSSNRARRLIPPALLLLLAACGPAHVDNPVAARENAHLGYVRMDDLVKRHPMYAELSRLDDDMAALQLRSAGTAVAVAPADLERQRREMQSELDAASARARQILADKQNEYSRRESAAIAAALAAAGQGGGAGISADTQQQARAQAAAASAAAQANLNRYRADVVSQNRAAIDALQRSLNASAERTYRTQSEQYSTREADYALSLANEDSASRLSLRAKLSNLVLEDAAREDARKQLEAIDRREADLLGAMKNRDAAALVALRAKLRADTQRELDRQAKQMNATSLAKINARELGARKELAGRLGSLPQVSGGPPLPATMSADLRARLEALHKKYQADFDADAKTTVDEFQRTRTELTQRFARLQGIDLAAQAGSGRELAALRKQRSDLYDQMVAQIGREVKLVAARRGIEVVLNDVVAPVGGVDLTADAEKDIESLHE